eukprot:TRINITY_DN23070_c0_g3_i1.p1 TRINITY_DN23070_c0_g3~~TRINITY_DN23070_c0_g3_i1.p1  ORF type:complete len:601 (+),score=208.03 TRINITY_DN23070_c0_g3_i1:95-1897(+)
MEPAGKGNAPAAPAGKGAPPLPPATAGKAPPPPMKGKGGPPPPGKGAGPAPPGKGLGKGPGKVVSKAGCEEALSGPKLKPLFWTAVKEVPADSVWERLAPPAAFDAAELQKYFVAAPAKQSSSTLNSARRSGSEGPGNESRKRVRLLDDRTSQMLGIVFKQLPPPERLVAILETLEDFPEGVASDALLALNTAASEQKEAVEKLRHLKVPEDELSQLDFAERYLWVLSKVPSCTAKLACGALLCGPAKELGDLRYAGLAVGTCCRALREADLLQRCISTSLAVGNFVNRGTSRAGARAVVLPDSLQKLDELRSTPQDGDADSAGMGTSRGMSLLDFVALSLVNAYGRGDALLLRAETEEIRAKVKAAQSVSLEEAENNCRKACLQAEAAWSALKELEGSPKVAGLKEKVRRVVEEAATAKTLLSGAKAELAKTQAWSSAKGKIKTEEWLAGWANFLDQLSQAFGKVAEEGQKRVRAATMQETLSRMPSKAGESQQQQQAAPQSTSREAALLSKALAVATTQAAPLAEVNVATVSGVQSKPKKSVQDEDCIGPGTIEQLLRTRTSSSANVAPAAPAETSAKDAVVKPKYSLFAAYGKENIR